MMQNKTLLTLMSCLSMNAYAIKGPVMPKQMDENMPAVDQNIDQDRQQMAKAEQDILQQIDQLKQQLRDLRKKPKSIKQILMPQSVLSSVENKSTRPGEMDQSSSTSSPVIEQKTATLQSTENKINNDITTDKKYFEDMVADHKASQQAFKDIMKQINDEESKKNKDNKLIADLEAQKDNIRKDVISKRNNFQNAFKKYQDDLARDQKLLEQSDKLV